MEIQPTVQPGWCSMAVERVSLRHGKCIFLPLPISKILQAGHIQDFSGANFQSFNTLADAQDAWDYACANLTTGPSRTPLSRGTLPFPTTPMGINITTRTPSYPSTPTQQGSRPVLQGPSLGLTPGLWQLTPVASRGLYTPPPVLLESAGIYWNSWNLLVWQGPN